MTSSQTSRPEELEAAPVGPPVTPSPVAPAQASERFAQAFLLALVFSIPALFCIHAASVTDPDLWWHLRSGEWILQHRAFPHTDPFSTYGAGRPWAAYSWLFEILVFTLFKYLGLVGVLIYSTVMVAAVTAALYRLVSRLNTDFSLCALLAFVASFSLGRLNSPRPWHFTILLFVLELDILLYARHTGRKRGLLWLPVIFLLWPNLHIQFIDGLLVLFLAAAESLAAPLAARCWPPARLDSTRPARTPLDPIWIVSISVLSVLATFCNPYGWGIYKIAWDLASQPGVLNSISELQAISFRSIPDFCALFLALAGAAALARAAPLSQTPTLARSHRIFEIVLFAAAVFLSFRSQRDIWLVSTVSAAVIAASFETGKSDHLKLPAFAWPAFAAATAVVLFTGLHVLHIDNARLDAGLAEYLPVQASQFVRANHLPGPLYNDYPWGGYLMWSLRQPVSIDGRAALYGTERMDRFAATWNAAPGWASDPDLQQARLVIGPARAPLTQLLRLDPRFQMVYEDHLAAIFTRH